MTDLQHDRSYYGEDRYDTGANRVAGRQNPLDDSFHEGLKESQMVEDSRARFSFGAADDRLEAESGSIGGRLKRMSSLSRMVPKVLTTKSSWSRMEMGIDGSTLSPNSDDSVRLKRKLSFVGRIKLSSA
jgi:hypothetical protein